MLPASRSNSFQARSALCCCWVPCTNHNGVVGLPVELQGVAGELRLLIPSCFLSPWSFMCRENMGYTLLYSLCHTRTFYTFGVRIFYTKLQSANCFLCLLSLPITALKNCLLYFAQRIIINIYILTLSGLHWQRSGAHLSHGYFYNYKQEYCGW